MAEYKCKHCQGKAQIVVLGDGEKATESMIEFCPFCGMPNSYPGSQTMKRGEDVTVLSEIYLQAHVKLRNLKYEILSTEAVLWWKDI